MSTRSGQRRLLPRIGTGIAVAAASVLALGNLPASSDDATIESSADPDTVRLLSVGAVLTDDRFQEVLAGFEAETGYTVELTMGMQDIMEQARTGTDIVLVHLGHTPLHDFVTEGRGRYPHTVMSNNVAILAPPTDPAGIKELDDPYEAFEAIAEHEDGLFYVNNLGETLYITNTLYEAAGQPDQGEWFIDEGMSGPPAVRRAAALGAYTIWGLHPFVQIQRSMQPVNLEAVLYNDSILQRIVATTVVNRPPGRVNIEGALALQEFLTSPAAQAQIRALPLPDRDDIHGDVPLLWPAGNQNDN